MKKFDKLFFAAAASLMMFSCSSDEPGKVPGGSSTEGDFFATLTLSLPQGGRADTEDWDKDHNTNSSDGYEVGNDKENKVGSVLVVLATAPDATATEPEAKAGYQFITYNLAAANASTETNARPTYNVQFESQDLKTYADKKVCVFTFCNPTTKLIELAQNKFAETSLINAVGNINDATIWRNNSFLMANHDIWTVTLPTTEQMEQTYNKPENPFNLGIIEVSRVSARFDFKQTTVAEMDEANLYPIYNMNNIEFDENNKPINKGKVLVGYVKLDGMAIMNLASQYYYLPRVSADGTDTDWTLCGLEKANNYVVSPEWAKKKAETLDVTWLKSYYDENGLTTYTVTENGAEVTKNAVDFSLLKFDTMGTNLGEDNDDDSTWGNDEDNKLSTEDKADYYIWRYASENTIPQFEGTTNEQKYAAQKTGVTTSIVFKGQIIASENDSKLKECMTAGETLYAYDGFIFGNLQMLKDTVIANPSLPAAVAFRTAFDINMNETEDGDPMTDAEYAEAVNDVTTFDKSMEGFALYRAEGTEGNYTYPVYYPYYNRHFNNGNNTEMGPMEFGVVRNNVYKLKVDNVLEFGHPAKPGDDPDPENPDNPDETPKTYFRLQVKVLPWVVRVNNIIL